MHPGTAPVISPSKSHSLSSNKMDIWSGRVNSVTTYSEANKTLLI